MHSSLKADSEFVKNAAVWAGFVWTFSNCVTIADNWQMGIPFLASSVTQLVDGQTKRGIYTASVSAFAGYGVMGVRAWQEKNYPELATSIVGGVAVCTNIVKTYLSKPADNQVADTYAQTINPVYFVTDELSTEQKPRSVTQDMVEISKRPLFWGSVIGAVADSGYLISGLQTLDPVKIIAGLGWEIGFAVNAVSISQNGQENILKKWAKNAWQQVMGSNHDNDQPNLPGQQPQIA